MSQYQYFYSELAESTLRPSHHYFTFGHRHGGTEGMSRESRAPGGLDATSQSSSPHIASVVSLDVQVETDTGEVLCIDEINEDSRNPRFIRKVRLGGSRKFETLWIIMIRRLMRQLKMPLYLHEACYCL